MAKNDMLRRKDRLIEKRPQYVPFIKYMKRTSKKRLRDTSCVSYIEQLESMVNKHGLDLERPDIVAVIDSLIDVDVTSMVINVRRTVLRKWAAFIKQPLTDEDREALKNQGGPLRRPLRKRDIIDEVMFEKILSLVDDTPRRAYYAILWDLGLRPSEGTGLDVKQVVQDEFGFKFLLDTEEDKVKNSWGLRAIYLIEPISIMHFQAWWAMHPMRDNPDAPLFLTKGTRRLKIQTARDLLRRVRKKLGIEVLNLYLFRKSMTTRWIALGRDERLLRYRLGHTKDSKMIEKHYLALDQSDFDRGHLALLGFEQDLDEKPASNIQCPHCGQINKIGRDACFRCGTALSEKERKRRTTEAVGHVITEMLENPSETFMDEYIAVFGEKVERLLQPIVNRMVSEALKKHK